MRNTHTFRSLALCAAALAVATWSASFVLARPSMGGRGGGGGGGRPGGGGMSRPGGGGGMARPAGGGGMSRPSMPHVSRPSMGNAGGRPPSMQRPQMPANVGRPSLGGAGGGSSLARPGGGGPSRPGGANIARPQLPSGANRPTVRPPGTLNPVTRPSPGGGFDRPGGINRPGGDRPSLGNVTRPSFPGGGFDRPDIGGGTRPGAGGGGIQRPLPDRPGGGTRPGEGGGGVQRPLPDRPGGGTRPGQDGGGVQRPLPDRPGGGTRPGQDGGGIQRPRPDRPIIGGGGTRPGQDGGGVQRPIPDRPDRPDRPDWANRPGRPDRPIIGPGDDTNINNNWNNVNINNRPGWGWGNRPGSDWWSQNHNWSDHWHDHCIHDHHDWYHGCWNNNWGNNWYAPLAWGAVGWGLGSWYGGSTSYYNPYYEQPVAAAVVPYDYSQPVVVNNYVSPDADTAGAATPAAQSPQNQQALTQFDQGMADFKAGNYQQALSRFDAALKELPNDPVVHEVRALALFALGKYQPAAAALNALLATAPGMDWTTMSSLYGNPDDYTQQLRKLETWCKGNLKDSSAYFVLAYHYLVTGHQAEAIDALRVVVREQSKDATAKRMLDSLAPPEQPAATAPAAIAATPTPTPAPGADAPQTDLVGSWLAKSGDSTIALTIGEDSQFTWKAAQKDKPPVELKGNLVVTSDLIVLESKEQGSMAGSVKSAGPDKWQFALAGAPPGEAGLSFERVKN